MKEITSKVMILFFACFSCGKTGDIVVDDVNDIKTSVILHCNGGKYEHFDIEDYDTGSFIKYEPETFNELLIRNCKLSSVPYAAVFEEHEINISSITRVVMEISKFSNDYDLQANHFIGLMNLIFLDVTYTEGIGRPQFGFLEPLIGLKWLEITNVVLPPMTTNSVIEMANLDYGSSTGSFGGCEKLKTLFLSTWEIESDLELSSCHNLTSFGMENLSSESVFAVLRGVKSIEWLKINSCNLLYLPSGIFDDMQQLKILDLSYNNLQEIPINNPMPSLLNLKLESNSMRYTAATENVLQNMPKLKVLSLAGNIVFDLCGTFFWEHNNTAVYRELKNLDLSDTTTKFECIDAAKVPALEEFHLKSSHKPIINLHNFVKWPGSLYVDLQYNEIKDLNFTREDYEILRIFKPNITITGDIKLKCDCQHAYLARSVRENLLKWSESDVICEDIGGVSLRQTLLNQTECNRTLCGDCVCRRMWWNNMTEADCRGASATRIPQVEKLQTLLASNNRIQLRSEDIPDTLAHIDLTQNNIVSIDEEVARKLFSVENRTILLAGNRLLCKCEYRNVIKLIQDNQKQILDYKTILCAGERERFLHSIDVNGLCIDNTALVASSSACGALLAIIVLAVIINHRFGKQIRIFIYARGWCLSCFEEDDETDRTYDVFVSFSHEDTEIVSEELVPQLEQLGYTTCIHYRDWAPGDLIPNQIIRSVEASRRTIIILSKNFVHSLWGSLEFKTAHARALKEGVPRVIVIVLDDVINSDDLDEEIRSYIRTNTYVNWDDPWLWDKLQYAMPRRRAGQNRGKIDTRNVGTPQLFLPPPDVPVVVLQ